MATVDSRPPEGFSCIAVPSQLVAPVPSGAPPNALTERSKSRKKFCFVFDIYPRRFNGAPECGPEVSECSSMGESMTVRSLDKASMKHKSRNFCENFKNHK